MIGVNTFGLINKMQDDMPGTMRTLADAGFDEVELLLLPKKKQWKIPIALAAKETIPLLIGEAAKCGLRVKSIHVFGSTLCFLIPRKKLARYLEELHCTYGIENFVFSEMFRDAKGAKKWAHFLKQLSDLIETKEIRILYHNHSQEFEMLQINETSMSALDYFFSLAGEKVGLQLDIGWAGVGGDELAIAQKYADRIVSINLKDFVPGTKGNFKNEKISVNGSEFQDCSILGEDSLKIFCCLLPFICGGGPQSPGNMGENMNGCFINQPKRSECCPHKSDHFEIVVICKPPVFQCSSGCCIPDDHVDQIEPEFIPGVRGHPSSVQCVEQTFFFRSCEEKMKCRFCFVLQHVV